MSSSRSKKIVFIIIAAILAAVLISLSCYFIIRLCIRKEAEKIAAGLDFPKIYINTQDGKTPANKTDYVNCSFKLTAGGGYDIDVSLKNAYGDENSVGIRLRGNSTLKFKKKPYRIKFDVKQSIFGYEKNKSWVLLADYLDPSSIRNYTAFRLASRFDGMDFVPHGRHVLLYLNNKLQGLYLLTEQMDENAGRAAVKEDFDPANDVDFPFLVEIDQNAFKEDPSGVNCFDVGGNRPIMVKYPEADERGEGTKVYDYIKEYMGAVYALLNNGNRPIEVSFRQQPVVLADLVDEQSLIDFYLVNEIMLNYDAANASAYMHKTKDGKLTFGPIWDFDNCMINKYTNRPAKYAKTDIADYLQVLNSSDIAYKWLQISGNKDRMLARFEQKKADIQATIDEIAEYKQYIQTPAVLDAKLWYGLSGEKRFEKQFDFVLDCLRVRMNNLPDLIRSL